MGGSFAELTAMIFAGFSCAFLAPFLVRRVGPKAFALLAMYPVLVFAVSLSRSFEGGSYPWIESLGIHFALSMDGFSRLFVLMISGLGTLILLYASSYFHSKPNLGRFAMAFLMFMASMIGIVLSDDLILLFIFWELTSITSFMLIGFDHENPVARKSAQQSLLVTAGGGLVMLIGFLLLGTGFGTFQISRMITLGIQGSWTLPAVGLILIGAMTKSAQFPFHFWLPNAMAGPTPVSAFLHSATMVKAGVFLLAKLTPIFQAVPQWGASLTLVGATTVVAAAVLMIQHRDAKKILAYSTISALGMLVFLLGQPGPYAEKAFVGLLVAHALYKGALFLMAGTLEHATNTRDVLAWRGLRSKMAVTAISGFLVGLASMGMVGFLGFWGKEYALLANPDYRLAIVVVFAVTAGIAGFRVAILPFLGKSPSHENAHDPPFAMQIGPLLLGICGLAFGVSAAQFGGAFLKPAQVAIFNDLSSKPWTSVPELNWAFAVSLALLGLTSWLALIYKPIALPEHVSLSRTWDLAVAALPRLCAIPTGLIQTGRLRDYFAMFFLLISICALFPFIGRGGATQEHTLDWPEFHEIAIVILAIGAAIAVPFLKSRLSAICLLGLVGTSVAVIFLAFGAPDLSVTQLLVEMLTLLLAVFVFGRLPGFRSLSSKWVRYRDAVIAGAFGTAVATLVYGIQGYASNPDVARYYADNAVSKAYGRNVVNTILVDFRAMDTLGEVSVLALAALGIYALMHLRGPKETEA